MKPLRKSALMSVAVMALMTAPVYAGSGSASGSGNTAAGVSTGGINAGISTSSAAAFNRNDRDALNGYLNELPSGTRTTTGANFSVGDALPHNTATSKLPPEINNRIAPAPSGYSYVQAGSNIYLISNTDRRILDRVGIR